MSKQRKPRTNVAAASSSAAADGHTFAINLNKAKSPPVVGFADQCAVIDGGMWWELMFLEGRGSTNAFVLARFVVMLDDLLYRVWPSVRGFLDEVDPVLSKSGLEIPEVYSGMPGFAIVTTAAARVTAFGTARAGLIAQLDGFVIPPRSLHSAHLGIGKLEVLPVLGVQLPVTLLIALLRRLRSSVQELEKRLPAGGAGSVYIGA